MRIGKAISMTANSRVALVGSGGKTAAMFQLARHWTEKAVKKQQNSTVLVSATTHLALDQLSLADYQLTITSLDDLNWPARGQLDGVILLTGPPVGDGRVSGLSLEAMARLDAIASERGMPLLIEADGSRRKPLKAPAPYEPPIPPFVDTVIVTAGMQGLGKPLGEEWVHRPVLFSKLTGLEMGAMVTPEALVCELLAKDGGLRNIPTGAQRIALLNQCDTPELAGQALRMGGELLSEYDQVVVAQLQAKDEESSVLAVYRQTAGVVLAAGGSERLGQPKQLLDWNGQPFVRAVAQTALAAGLSPVFVVVGAEKDMVAAGVEGLDVIVLENPDWVEGQSTSLRAGVQALPKEAAAAVFLLSDQPQIPARLVETVLAEYARTLAPVVAPLVDERRGNPVLFDRVTFSDLMKAKGDKGGRQVFAKYRVHTFPWVEARDGLDVDTWEDYERLLGEG
jgi:molybdenum cofactor cytidylyltransferase